MHELSVITATPPGYNPGMLVVELSAHDFLRRHGLLELREAELARHLSAA